MVVAVSHSIEAMPSTVMVEGSQKRLSYTPTTHHASVVVHTLDLSNDSKLNNTHSCFMFHMFHV